MHAQAPARGVRAPAPGGFADFLPVSDAYAEPDVESLARELEAYVASHPSAADTVESVARWWLPHAAQPSLKRVEAALDLLASRGVVARYTLPDGRFLYQRAPRESARRNAGLPDRRE